MNGMAWKAKEKKGKHGRGRNKEDGEEKGKNWNGKERKVNEEKKLMDWETREKKRGKYGRDK